MKKDFKVFVPFKEMWEVIDSYGNVTFRDILETVNFKCGNSDLFKTSITNVILNILLKFKLIDMHDEKFYSTEKGKKEINSLLRKLNKNGKICGIYVNSMYFLIFLIVKYIPGICKPEIKKIINLSENMGCYIDNCVTAMIHSYNVFYATRNKNPSYTLKCICLFFTPHTLDVINEENNGIERKIENKKDEDSNKNLQINEKDIYKLLEPFKKFISQNPRLFLSEFSSTDLMYEVNKRMGVIM